jgi:transposase
LPPSADDTNPTTTKTKDIKGHGRRQLPRNLRRERREHTLPEAEQRCPCCQKPRVKIGEEISEQLDYKPAELFVIEHARFKYACHHCAEQAQAAQLVTAPKPAGLFTKGLPGAGLVAHTIVCKYADHLPLHRQERIYQRAGVELSRKTLCDWMAGSAELLTPLYDMMVSLVLASRVIHTDDTHVPIQDDQRDTTRKGRLWIYLGDRDHAYNVFAYTPSRARDGPQTFLADFRGHLQADAFSGYDGIYTNGQVQEVACWAHARRKFYEARTSDAARSHQALARIGRLYDLERAAKEQSERDELSVEQADALRLHLRQEQAVPELTALRHWLNEQAIPALPKSPMGQAINYAVNQWDALVRYTTAGFLAIDNNAAERALRAIAIGRKNWLFCGSDKGGHTAATLFTMTSTCQRHRLDPFAYLRDVLPQLAAGPQSAESLAALLPDRWTPPA